MEASRVAQVERRQRHVWICVLGLVCQVALGIGRPDGASGAVSVFAAPELDVPGRSDRADRGRYSCYREPVVVKTKSGRLVVGCHAGNRQGWPERSGQDLVIRWSDNHGKTWDTPVVAAEHGNYSVQSHGMVYDAEIGRLFCLYVTYNWDYTAVGKGRGSKYTAPLYKELHAKGKPFQNAWLVQSDDGGETWSKPRDIGAMAGKFPHFGASEGRQLVVGKHKGRLMLAGGKDRLTDASGAVTQKRVGVWISDDHGESWGFSEISTPKEITSPRNVSCEARVTELPDGTLIYNVRTRNTGRQLATSRDGGESWTETSKADELVAAQCNGSMLTLTDGTGQLTKTVLCSLPRGPGRKNGVIYVSSDGGKTWPVFKQVIPGAFAYSAIVQLDAETIGLFYETNHHKTINFLTIPINQIIETGLTLDRPESVCGIGRKAG